MIRLTQAVTNGAILTACMLCSLLVAASHTQAAVDAANQDVVLVGSGTLEVGVSRPIRIAVTNDRATVAFNFGLIFNTVDSGFARFDSVVFTGRMTDTKVLNLRLGGGVNVDGISPDTIVTSGFYAGSGNIPLPAGDGDIYAVYMTGVRPGHMAVANGFLPPGGDFAMIEKIGDFNTDFYHPGFVGRTVTINSAGTMVCGNADGSSDGSVDIADLTVVVDYLFINFTTPPDFTAANVDGSLDGVVDLSDLTMLVNFLFINGGTLGC